MDEDRSTAPPALYRQGKTEASSLAPRLRASWQRSRRYGVTPEEMRPAFTGSLNTDSLLYACGDEVLRGLQATLANEPVSLMITGSDGLVLSRLCADSSISRSLDQVHLAPGFYFAESNAGTNGLGLALADRTPSLVRADEHYCTELRGYTCAAAPVLDPVTGELAGSVNLTTWSDTSSALLLALAQSAAANTSALMLARGTGRKVRPLPRGEVFHVYAGQVQDQDEVSTPLSARWTDAVAEACTAMAHGQVVAFVGEPGTGKTTLASLARRETQPRERVLCARPPAVADIESWLTLWIPELHKDRTCVIVAGADTLPAWVADELAGHITSAGDKNNGGEPRCLLPLVITAGEFSAIPDGLRPLVGAVVEVPPLRSRPQDVLPLAHHFARRHRGCDVTFTAAAARAMTNYHWPHNTRELQSVVRSAVSRTNIVDTQHLPAELFTNGTRRQLSRLQTLERDEIIRCLTEPATTVAQAADRLGMSRATIYRKMAQYDIKIAGRTRGIA